MALDKMTLPELKNLAVKLREMIARNPQHSRMERVELEDVSHWIALRLKESEPSRPISDCAPRLQPEEH